MEELALMVRFHRRMAGLNQKELAEKAGVGKSTVFELEKGKKTVQLDSLIKILNALNIDIVFKSQIMNEFNTFKSSQ